MPMVDNRAIPHNYHPYFCVGNGTCFNNQHLKWSLNSASDVQEKYKVGYSMVAPEINIPGMIDKLFLSATSKSGNY